MQLTEEWTPSPMHEIGASFLHASPPPFLYKQPASPPLHTLGYHTGRLPLGSPSDSTLSACLVCVEALEVLTLSPLLSSSLRGSPVGIHIHNNNKEAIARKLWQILESTSLHLLQSCGSLAVASTTLFLPRLRRGSAVQNFLSLPILYHSHST